MLVAIVVMMVVIETVLLVVMMMTMVLGTLTTFPGPRQRYASGPWVIAGEGNPWV
jgi:hypothetical protein